VIKLRPSDHIEMRPSKFFQNLTEQASSSSSQSQLVGILEEKDAAGKVVNSQSAV
jgi:hypothetical protein